MMPPFRQTLVALAAFGCALVYSDSPSAHAIEACSPGDACLREETDGAAMLQLHSKAAKLQPDLLNETDNVTSKNPSVSLMGRQRPSRTTVSEREVQNMRLLMELRAAGFTCPKGNVYAPNSKPMRFDCKLWRASFLHSQDMTNQDYFSHTGKNGSSPWARADAQGAVANGENIAAGSSTAQGTIEQWKKSDGHCNNMMKPGFASMAVGHASGDGKYTHYWTQMFANKVDDDLDKSCYPGAPPKPPTKNCSETMTGIGEDYHGCQTRTKSGLPCQRWDATSPHWHPYSHDTKKYRLTDNHCRNPDVKETIWCFTLDPNVRWEYCKPIGQIDTNNEKPSNGTEPSNGKDSRTCNEAWAGNGKDYRGCQQTTRNGKTCQAWNEQSPHVHTFNSYKFPSAGLENNYCRNPDGDAAIWCFTTDPNWTWAYCDAIEPDVEVSTTSITPTTPWGTTSIAPTTPWRTTSTSAAVATTSPGTGDGQAGCTEKNSLGKCEQCLTSDQCGTGRYCCPFMKKCVASGEGCNYPIAFCNPRCYDRDDPSKCKCREKDFPLKWQKPTCTAEGAGGASGTSTAVITTTQAVVTTSPDEDEDEEYECIEKNSLGKCSPCLTSDQCDPGRYCCPYMKKCVSGGREGCGRPIADCNPKRCYDRDDVNKCQCNNPDFPLKWQLPTCGSRTKPTTTTEAIPFDDATKVDPKDWESFKLLNALRAKGFKCPRGNVYPPNPEPLRFDCLLWQASRIHSKDMMEQGYFSHRSKDGRSPWDRAREHGTSANGENIAAGSGSASGTLRQWKRSDGHCNNMGKAKFRTVAIGMAPGGRYRYYWTEMFSVNTLFSELNTECYPDEALVLLGRRNSTDASDDLPVELPDLGEAWGTDSTDPSLIATRRNSTETPDDLPIDLPDLGEAWETDSTDPSLIATSKRVRQNPTVTPGDLPDPGEAWETDSTDPSLIATSKRVKRNSTETPGDLPDLGEAWETDSTDPSLIATSKRVKRNSTVTPGDLPDLGEAWETDSTDPSLIATSRRVRRNSTVTPGDLPVDLPDLGEAWETDSTDGLRDGLIMAPSLMSKDIVTHPGLGSKNLMLTAFPDEFSIPPEISTTTDAAIPDLDLGEPWEG